MLSRSGAERSRSTWSSKADAHAAGRGDRGPLSDRGLRRAAADRRLLSSTAIGWRARSTRRPGGPLPYLRERPLPGVVVRQRAPLSAHRGRHAGRVALVTGGAPESAARPRSTGPHRSRSGDLRRAARAARGRLVRRSRRPAALLLCAPTSASPSRSTRSLPPAPALRTDDCSSTMRAASSSPRPRRSRRTAGVPSTGQLDAVWYLTRLVATRSMISNGAGLSSSSG